MKKIVFVLSVVLVSIVSAIGQANVNPSPLNDKFFQFENQVFEKMDINSDQKSMLNESLIWHKIQMNKITKETPSTDPSLATKVSNQRLALENKVKGFLSTEQQRKLKVLLTDSQDKATGFSAGE
jgi:hypothetical protein